MFQFSGLALFRVIYLQYIRLSHSEIFGLSIVCIYPKLIAAYHVLHRLLVPRHPPCALIRFKYCILITLGRVTFEFINFNLSLLLVSCIAAQTKIAFPICQRTSVITNLRKCCGLEPLALPLQLHLLFAIINFSLTTPHFADKGKKWRISESNR